MDGELARRLRAGSMDVSHKEHEAVLLESSQDRVPVAALPFSVPHDPVVNRSGWPRTVVIITAEVMGAGVLGLPFDFARLGWVLGLAACLFFATTAVYAGLLLARVRCSLYPGVCSYGEVAQLAVGPRFGAFTRACVYSTWAMYLPYYLLTCTSALRLALGQLGVHGWCTWQIAALVSSLLALRMQMRNLHLIAYLGALSSTATLLAVALVVAALLNHGPTPGVTHALCGPISLRHTTETSTWRTPCSGCTALSARSSSPTRASRSSSRSCARCATPEGSARRWRRPTRS